MTKEEIEAIYQERCSTPSDINQHLPILREYADKCESVCEMGVRGAVSLYAFLASKANKVIAIDIVEAYRPPETEKLAFICGDTLKIEIEPVDFLFIDTVHNYKQLKQELALHFSKVKKFIGFHDTTTFGINGDDGSVGLLQAITEHLSSNPCWRIVYQTEVNNGLIIIEKWC